MATVCLVPIAQFVACVLTRLGEGYWSAGTRLIDSERVGAQDLVEGDLPEYMVHPHPMVPEAVSAS